MTTHDLDSWHMARALELARRGEGSVEPNPMVGCVVAHGAEVIGEGWHRRFGGPHAEVEALRVAGERALGATLFVTLEPCCHQGKTPPCTDAVLAAGVGRVVIAQRDPFPAVAGGGIAQLQSAGLEVVVGVREEEARELNAPYLKLLSAGRPWIIAKWAMTLDGKIATRGGDSHWISNDESRRFVHELRGRVDAILVGRGTVQRDDPLLTARPPGVRVATRIVLDRHASLSSTSKLIQTLHEAPLMVATGPEAAPADCERLRSAGCEVLTIDAPDRTEQLHELLAELGRRRLTNLLVEGGGEVLGAFFDAHLMDEVLAFVAPKLLGGAEARTPIAGHGRNLMSEAIQLANPRWQDLGGDLLLRARCRWA